MLMQHEAPLTGTMIRWETPPDIEVSYQAEERPSVKVLLPGGSIVATLLRWVQVDGHWQAEVEWTEPDGEVRQTVPAKGIRPLTSPRTGR